MFKRIITSAVLILSMICTGLMYYSPTVSAATKNPDKVCDFLGMYISSMEANRPCVMSPANKFAPQVLGTDGRYYTMESGCFDQVATTTAQAGTCYIIQNPADKSYTYKAVVCARDVLGTQAETCATPTDYSSRVSITSSPFNGTTQGILNCPVATSTIGNTTFKGSVLTDGTYAFALEQCKPIGSCPINTYGTGIQSGCTPCPAGSFSVGGSTKAEDCKVPVVTPCTNGASNAPSCNVCPADKDAVIMSNAFSCVVKCVLPQIRDAVDQTKCITPTVTPCDANQYGAGKPNCTPCAAGFTSPIGSTTMDKCIGIPVVPCPANTYGMSVSAGCIPCPAGFTSPAGSITADKCTTTPVVPVVCANGGVAPSCITCPADKDGIIAATGFMCVAKCIAPQVRDVNNMANCITTTATPCPANTYGDGKICTPCASGFNSPAGSVKMEQCIGTPTPPKKDEGGGTNWLLYGGIAAAAACIFFCGGLFGGGKKEEKVPNQPETPNNPPVDYCDYYNDCGNTPPPNNPPVDYCDYYNDCGNTPELPPAQYCDYYDGCGETPPPTPPRNPPQVCEEGTKYAGKNKKTVPNCDNGDNEPDTIASSYIEEASENTGNYKSGDTGSFFQSYEGAM